MSGKLPSIPGFTAVSDQVLVREGGRSDASTSANHPSTVLIYGWGDGLPKHVAKFADGYRVLFPNAKQIVILSPISKALFSDLQARTGPMKEVIKAAFPSGAGADAASSQEGRILVHAASNTGGVNYAATLNGYRQLYDQALPHQLLVLDSAPGSTNFTYANLLRWSRAMALGTAAWFPWPFAVTQGIWAFCLGVNGCYEWAVGRESAGAWSRGAVNDAVYEDGGARKLYLYSKEDDLIGWEDIETHAAESRQKGWEADMEVFEGSKHVGHMRQAPEQYWKAVKNSWDRASAGGAVGKS